MFLSIEANLLALNKPLIALKTFIFKDFQFMLPTLLRIDWSGNKLFNRSG